MMLPFSRRWPLVAVPVVIIVVLVAAVAFGPWVNGSGRADVGVRVVQAGSPGAAPAERMFPGPREALAYASSTAGFEVAAPARLPSGYALVEIDVPPKPPSAASGVPLRATLKIRKGDKGFQILAVNQRFQFDGDDASHVIASPSAGSQVFKAVGDQSIEYTLLTPTRGFVITSPVPGPLTDDEAIRILGSLSLN